MNVEVFSQQNIPNDCDVCLKEYQSKAVIKDLIKGKALSIENDILNSRIELYIEKDKQKDSIIGSYKEKDSNYKSILQNKDSEISLHKENTELFKTELNSQKKKTGFWQITTMAATILAVIGIIK